MVMMGVCCKEGMERLIDVGWVVIVLVLYLFYALIGSEKF
ncbi:hypothetical protein JMUB7498_26610 [Staphylococcus aureus]